MLSSLSLSVCRDSIYVLIEVGMYNGVDWEHLLNVKVQQIIITYFIMKNGKLALNHAYKWHETNVSLVQLA